MSQDNKSYSVPILVAVITLIGGIIVALIENYGFNLFNSDEEGWYISEVNQSCDAECARHEGLECNTKSIKRMRSINNESAFKVMNASGPNVHCKSYGDDPHPITPFKIISSGYNQCEWRRETDNVTCEAINTESGEMYQRFCFCAKVNGR